VTEVFRFEVTNRDQDARAGLITTPRGAIRTPAFMRSARLPPSRRCIPKGESARRRYSARQYLSSHVAARRGADRGVGRPPSIHELALAYPNDSGGFRSCRSPNSESSMRMA